MYKKEIRPIIGRFICGYLCVCLYNYGDNRKQESNENDNGNDNEANNNSKNNDDHSVRTLKRGNKKRCNFRIFNKRFRKNICTGI